MERTFKQKNKRVQFTTTLNEDILVKARKKLNDDFQKTSVGSLIDYLLEEFLTRDDLMDDEIEVSDAEVENDKKLEGDN